MKTMKRLFRSALVALGLSALAVGSAFAASNVDGYIVGEVQNTDGAAVADATVTVSNPQTGYSRTMQTDDDGSFRFPSLSVGTYSVSIQKSGYQDSSRNATVNVGVGTNLYVTLLQQGEEATELGTVTVSGSAISPIDITSTETSTNLGEATIDRIPVARNISGVALLAPGTTQGDDNFGNLVSFNGATVGENQCYINGLNVTNFRNGLGCNTVPFEFYQEFQLKTGGYSAEFGRATGGVINAVTKSGTNEFHYGGSLYFEPWIEDLNGNWPDVFTAVDPRPDTPGDNDQDDVIPGGTLYQHNQLDENSSMELNLWASGPIIEDKLFFFVMYNPRNVEATDKDGTIDVAYETETDDAFWGTKIDWLLSDSHKLELTAFSDSRTVTQVEYAYAYPADVIGAQGGTSISERGGENAILKYTGYLTDDFTLSASYGINKYSLTDTLTADILSEPLVVNNTVSPPDVYNPLGGGPFSSDEDERKQIRLDAEWFLGDHLLRFGFDQATLTSTTNAEYSGGVFYGIDDYVVANPGPEVLEQIYRVQGEFETLASAIYIEDKWQVTRDLMLSLGVRNETFENKNKVGQVFVEQSNQIAPRLGFSWDAMGDGSLKVFGNYGRYYLPVANNTNVRLAGGEFFVQNYYTFPGTFTGPIPDLGTLISSNQLANGIPPDPRIGVDQQLDPMYQDELILGFSKDVGNGWVVGLRGIYRELGSTIEDLTIDEALNQPGAFNYVLANPGEDITVYVDANGDSELTGSELTPVTFTAEELGYPESVRNYLAWQFEFEKVWDGEWFLKGSYVWSHNYGNNEGYVRSDNNQTDSGLTTLYDFAGLLDGAYGDLPNDRRHTFKVYGAWQFAEHWQVGANVLMQSGRPINAFGNHPTDVFSALYGHEAFYQNGELVPRGSRGNTPFISSIDLSLKYMTEVADGDLTLGLDVFNVFNATNSVEVREIAEANVAAFTLGPGRADLNYGLPTGFQTPRYVRLSAELTF